MTKKIFLIILICLSFLFLDTTGETTMLVNESVEEIGYYVYEVKIDNLNTKNFIDYFDDEYRILKIYPFINPIYSYDKNIISEYSFLNKSIKYNISYFEKVYLNSVDKYYNEREKYIISGIPIDRVVVYASNFMIDDLITKGKVQMRILN